MPNNPKKEGVYKSILDVPLKDTLALGQFVKDVEKGIYSKNFFHIKTIDILNASQLEHWLNVCDISDKLVSYFCYIPEFDIKGRPMLLNPVTFGLIKRPARDRNGRKLYETMSFNGKEVEVPKMEDVLNVPIPPIKNRGQISSIDWSDANGNSYSNQVIVANSQFKDEDINYGNVNPTSCYLTKRCIREMRGGTTKEVLEYIRIPLGNYEEDGQTLYKEIQVSFDHRSNQLLISPLDYDRLKHESIEFGNTDWSRTSVDAMTLDKQIEQVAQYNDPAKSQDMLRKIQEYTKELLEKENSTTRTVEDEPNSEN